VYHQGICFNGWHIPSNADWDKLMRYVDNNTGTSNPYNSHTAGKYLKATSGWGSYGNGEDTYGFSALPGGSDGTGTCTGTIYGSGGSWWSTNEYSSSLRSVRCVERTEVLYATESATAKKFLYIHARIMFERQYLEFYNYFWKFRRLPIGGVSCKNESEGANRNLSFFACGNKKLGICK
jgi:uncharacterized protein (TIGR02145 family)